jgi:predicted DNA-binding transcriptional regulator AlpA
MPMSTTAEELRPKEVSRELGRSRKWLWDAVRKGQFPAPQHRNCRCLVWTRDVVEAYKATHELRQRRKPIVPIPPKPTGLRLAAILTGRTARIDNTPMPMRAVAASGVRIAAGNNEITGARNSDDVRDEGPSAPECSSPAISVHEGQVTKVTTSVHVR